MNKLLLNEWYKMKHSSFYFVSLMLAVSLPVLMMVFVLVTRSEQSSDVVTINVFMGMNLRIISRTFAICFYTLLASEIIVREFKDNTFKSQLTIPIPRTYYYLVKVIFVSIWTIALIFLSCMVALCLSIFIFNDSMTFEVVYQSLNVFIKTGFLILPFLYFSMMLAILTKSNFIVMTFNMVVYLITMLTSGIENFYYLPWAIPFNVVFREVELTRFSVSMGYVSLFIFTIGSILIGDYIINKIEI